MSFSRRSFFRSLRSFGSSYFSDSSKGRKPNRTIHGRRLHLEPLEDRSLLSVGVSGMVWNDANLDGLQNAEELGAAGAVAEVFSSTDDVVGNLDDVSLGVAITDADGVYSFADLPEAANYYVVFRTPVGYEFTEQDAGGYDSFDSDANAEGVTDLFTIPADTTALHVDAGLVGDSPDFGWAATLNNTTSPPFNRIESVETDSAGNVFVAGHTGSIFPVSTDIDFNRGVAKYSPSGALIWSSQIGGEGNADVQDITLAEDGSVYITGNFTGTVDFDPRGDSYELTSAGLSDIFVMKLDADGNLVWAESFGGENNDAGQSISLDSNGDVYFCGYFSSTVDFDPGEGEYSLTSSSTYDRFVSKLDSDGNFIWAKSWDGLNLYIRDIAVADNDAVFITGYFSGDKDFDPSTDEYTLTSVENDSGTSSSDAFVVKLDANGDFLWATSLGSAEDDAANSVAVTESGDVYIGGYSDGWKEDGRIILYYGYSTTSSEQLEGDAGIFVAKLDASGTLAWVESFESRGSSYVTDIAFGPQGNIYFTGSFRGAIYFESGSETFTLSNGGIFSDDPVAYAAVLDADGNFVYAYCVDSTEYSSGKSISVDADGSVYVAGSFKGAVDFDPSSADYVLEGYSFRGSLREFFVQTPFLWKVYAVAEPTDLTLSKNNVMERLSVGSIVGEFSADSDSADTFTYTLVSGDGDDDNDSFSLTDHFVFGPVNGVLHTSEVFDASEKDTYSIRIRATDEYGQYVEKIFTITILDVLDVHGWAWDDVNGNGLQDDGENSMANATVELYSSADDTIGNDDDMIVDTTTTDSEGRYYFTGLTENTNYYVTFRTPVGYEFTIQGVGDDDTIDSDVDHAGTTALFSIEEGQNDVIFDAGLIGASPEFGWALNGGTADERASAEAVAIDDDGNTYVAGYFAGTVDFDSGPGAFNLTSAGEYDVFVAKYSADGALVWAKSFGGESADKGFDLARAIDGSLYVTGYFYDTADFDPSEGVYELTSAGDNDAFTMKLDADGNLVWATAIGDEHADLTRSIAIGADESILTTGYTTDEDQELAIEPNTDIVIHKQDADGNLIWTKTIGGDDSDEGAGVTVADDGSVFVTGYFSGTTDFDPGEDVYNITVGPNYYGYGDDDPDNYDNIQDSFVLKLDADGNFVWATGLDGNEVDVLNDIAIAPDGSVYATGSSSKQIPWWTIVPIAFPVQFFPTVIGGPNGGCILNDYYGSISADFPFISDLYAVEASNSGIVTYSGTSSVDGEQGMIFASLNATVETNIIGLSELGSLLVKLDADGNLLWSESYGDQGSEGAGVTVGADGNIYVAGNLIGETNFNSDVGGFMLDGGDGRALVSVWNVEGEFVKAYLADSSDSTIGHSAIGHDLAVSAVGDVYMAGTFNGTTDFDPTGGEYNLTNIGDADFFVCKFLAVETPTAIALSSQSVADGLEAGTLVGDLDTADGQTGAAFTYTLVEGQGDDDNASFAIEGNQLHTNEVFDCSVKDSYSIRVRSTDNFGQYVEEAFTITIIDETGPVVTLDTPSYTNDTTPSITVTSTEGETVYLDVDLNNDGDFDDDGEAGHTTATLTDGSAAFDISPELADGTYNLRARVSDAAENEGVSDVETMTIDTHAPSISISPPAWLTFKSPYVYADVQDAVYGHYTYVSDSILALLDIDMNGDGDYNDPGETGALSVSTVDGHVTFDLTSYIPDNCYGELNTRARAIDLAGNEGVFVFSLTVATVPPDVTITAPAITNSSSPEVTVSVTHVAFHNFYNHFGPAILDVDLNRDGDFDDEGEMDYTTAALANGTATFQVSPELAEGTYNLRARVTDLADQEGTSDVATMTVDMTAPAVSIIELSDAISIHNRFEYQISYDDANFDASTLTAADVELITTGTAAGTFWVGQGNGATRQITISDISGQGTFAIAIASGTASDLAGNLAPAAGPSDPIAVGHRIDSVVVVERDPSERNGILESNESLVLTWAVRGTDDATAVELLIDGQTVRSVLGPYMSPNGAYQYAGLFGALASGSHSFTINSTDSFGNTATLSGTFNIAEATVAGPAISNVVVMEAARENGKIESDENVVISWSATGGSEIVSRSLKIDGQAVQKMYGPYGVNYSGVFGPLAAGEHAYEITVTDANGADAVLTGTFSVVAAPAIAGPTISNIVVAEAAWENGKLESNENLVISWSAIGESEIVSRSLKIDGQAVQKMYGPYGVNYSGVFGSLSAGSHAYEITVTDANGADAVLTGTFSVVAAPSVAGPTISNIVVAEAAWENGKLESNENLVISWAATGGSEIVSRSLKIDGQAVQKMFGPYGVNYSGVFGPLAAGSHDYEIIVTDANGAQATQTGTFTVAAAPAVSPTISNIVIMETVKEDGVLESDENVVISWSATSDSDIVSRSLTVDGQAVQKMYGPYGANYSGVFGPLSAGTHNYEIIVTDVNGADAVLTGTFDVAQAATSTSTFVSGTSTTFNGGTLAIILPDYEHIPQTDAITLEGNGGSVNNENGPFQLANLVSVSTFGSGMLTLGSQTLALDADVVPSVAAATLTDAELAAITAEAARRWKSALGEEATAVLDDFNTEVVNLGNNSLAGTYCTAIFIDNDALGHGWFVDLTPALDEEFAEDDYGSLIALEDGEAAGRADLLTAVMHEMGEILGQTADELADSMMPLGRRITAV